MTEQYLVTFFFGVLSTVLGGLILGFLFFLARERVYPLPRVAGRWYVEMRFERSSYKPYEGMVLRYVAALWREGSSIKGSAEKVYEDSSTGVREYVGTNRTRAVIEGYAGKLIFSPDLVSVHIVEEGHGRQSTNFHELTVRRDGRMTGTFSTMAADCTGEVTWQRQPF